MATKEDDYTKYRSTGVTWTVDDIIGRSDYKKYRLATDTPTTVSGNPGAILV